MNVSAGLPAYIKKRKMVKLMIFSIHDIQILYKLNCLAVEVYHIALVKVLCFPEWSL